MLWVRATATIAAAVVSIAVLGMVELFKKKDKDNKYKEYYRFVGLVPSIIIAIVISIWFDPIGFNLLAILIYALNIYGVEVFLSLDVVKGFLPLLMRIIKGLMGVKT